MQYLITTPSPLGRLLCSPMEFLKRICPDAPYVWNRKGVPLCFSDIVLGFGVNIVTLAIIAAVKATGRSKKDNRSISLWEKVALFIIPVLGACATIFDMVLLLRQELDGYVVVFHQWLFYGSLFVVWVTILFVSKYNYQSAIHCNLVLCLWWIIKLFIWIPRLQAVYSMKKEFLCLRESFIAILDIGFGILINFIRTQAPISSDDSLKDPLLPSKIDHEEDRRSTLGFEHNVWGLLTFKSINPVLECGVKRQLDTKDLVQVPVDMDSCCYNLLQQFWEDQQGIDSSLPLLKTLWCSHGWPYFRIGLLKVVNDCLNFVGPVLLNKLIRFLQQGSDGYDGYIFAVALGLASIFKSFLDTQYSFHLAKLRLKLRSGIMTMIYRKCLYVKLAERSKFSEGEIQTFMSVDADRVVNMCNTIHDMWSLPLQIGVALYLLYKQVKFAFLSGLAITILLIPINKWIAELISKATKSMMDQKDERIRRTAELLTNIRTLKMYGWEHLFADWLMKTRLLEVKYLSTRKYLDAWCVFFWATTPTLFSLFTFGLYTLMGHQLDAATVFTCLALFNNLISPLNSFPWVINGLIDALISSRRLSNYLSCSEHKSTHLFSNQSTHEDMAVVLSNASCTLSSSDTDSLDLLLKNVQLSIPKGYMVVVTGEVGSGKSSLLHLILEESRLVRGSVCLYGSTTYVSQVPWIMSGTIRDNILLGRSYDPRRYSEVLKACSLEFDISLMIGGDMACIGEKGLTLSGGQRARLALARAVYCGSDIYLLDDVLSAVDAHVAYSILNNAILGPLLSNQTRLLCTHNVQAINAADMVIEMDKGQVKWVGKPSDLTFSSFLASPSIDKLTTSEVKIEETSSSATCVTIVPELDVLNNVSEQVQVNIEPEARKEGRVELVVYKKYTEFAGWTIAILTCLSAVLMQASRNGNDMWLSYWVDTTGTTSMYSTTFYLVILLVFCLVNSSLTLARAFSFAFGGLRAAIRVHDQLLNGIIKAPVSFFDQTPSGRILNRFSSDLYTIDDSLPFILNILLANFVGLLGIVLVLSYVQVIFFVLLVPFGYIYSKLQFYYRSTSRELRRLDSVSRSPIYASFTETLDGASTIRAFKSEEYFLLKFIQHIELYQKTSYSEVTASLWLSLRLQLLAAFIVSFVAVMAVIGSRKHLPLYLGTPGLVGLALSYAAPIVSLLGSFLTSFAETEKEMVSIERVLQYMELPQEDIGEQNLDLNWPSKGEIQFQNVTLRYRPSLPAALHDVSFTITGGIQVGVIGRTGAGKSSILNSILRLNPICGGQIFVDNTNIAGISIRYLRSRFAVVPQSPFLFEGSLRENLDPMQQKDDIEIWNMLKKCHVKEEVEALGEGIDIQVKECGNSFSVGQRQLLCLARALLKSSKVIFLDECTASVDTKTASKLQDTIANECKGTTVITIAHRISTVFNVDTVLILDQGNLVEQGNPKVLLQDGSSRFSSFVKASTM